MAAPVMALLVFVLLAVLTLMLLMPMVGDFCNGDVDADGSWAEYAHTMMTVMMMMMTMSLGLYCLDLSLAQVQQHVFHCNNNEPLSSWLSVLPVASHCITCIIIIPLLPVTASSQQFSSCCLAKTI